MTMHYRLLDRYSAENSAIYGAIRNTSHPRLRQKLSNEVWGSISSEVYTQGPKLTLLTNGPLTNLANIIKKYKKAKMLIQVCLATDMCTTTLLEV